MNLHESNKKLGLSVRYKNMLHGIKIIPNYTCFKCLFVRGVWQAGGYVNNSCIHCSMRITICEYNFCFLKLFTGRDRLTKQRTRKSRLMKQILRLCRSLKEHM